MVLEIFDVALASLLPTVSPRHRISHESVIHYAEDSPYIYVCLLK